jgi:hypothetical protein
VKVGQRHGVAEKRVEDEEVRRRIDPSATEANQTGGHCVLTPVRVRPRMRTSTGHGHVVVSTPRAVDFETFDSCHHLQCNDLVIFYPYVQDREANQSRFGALCRDVSTLNITEFSHCPRSFPAISAVFECRLLV